jgi:methyltransferase (TIGR00027 family)
MKPNMLLMIQRMQETLGQLTLPNLSNSIGVAKLRYIQSVSEEPKYRNPDTLVREFLSPPLRWLSRLQGRLQLGKLQSRPFYHYLIARTIHYDQVFTDAIRNNSKYIVNIGCGGDTRAYRFAKELNQRKAKVLECDQPQSIAVKQELAERKWSTEHISYIPIDLNTDDSWTTLANWLAAMSSAVLVIMEGVSNYIEEEQFRRFLGFLADKLHDGSRVAYDYKIRDISYDLESSGHGKRRFALPAAKDDVVAYHEALGYNLDGMALSSELASRLLPKLGRDISPFAEDCLLTLTVERRAARRVCV